MRVGINGMGRIGRLALRAAMGAAERGSDDPRAGNRLEVVHLNEIKGGAAATAHLLQFDSVQGRWRKDIEARRRNAIRIGEHAMGFIVARQRPADIPWGDLGVDVVLECTGKFLTPDDPARATWTGGPSGVIVAAPVKDR
ncbi:MAG: glyceraldehyde 3-phosphate dehydrogenase NAD-binding domain-containing protein [Ideonella sp.]|nr:glyceraldehyde 3-phosphate dehydrogenase NAD-binding domain-containing protein [Ideonella sp.]